MFQGQVIRNGVGNVIQTEIRELLADRVGETALLFSIQLDGGKVSGSLAKVAGFYTRRLRRLFLCSFDTLLEFPRLERNGLHRGGDAATQMPILL